MIAIIVVFLIPIFYIAKSKGYNALFVCIVSGLIALLSPYLTHMIWQSPLLPIADITIPLVVLIIVWLLPAKKNAPGKSYLKITFSCPECGETVTFKRHLEGKAELCPSCGEIITVPLDEHSPKPTQQQQRTRPAAENGKVCFESYGSEIRALEVQSLLEDNGIASSIIDGTGSGMLTQLSITQGFKLIIDNENWDKANSIIID